MSVNTCKRDHSHIVYAFCTRAGCYYVRVIRSDSSTLLFNQHKILARTRYPRKIIIGCKTKRAFYNVAWKITTPRSGYSVVKSVGCIVLELGKTVNLFPGLSWESVFNLFIWTIVAKIRKSTAPHATENKSAEEIFRRHVPRHSYRVRSRPGDPVQRANTRSENTCNYNTGLGRSQQDTKDRFRELQHKPTCKNPKKSIKDTTITLSRRLYADRMIVPVNT